MQTKEWSGKDYGLKTILYFVLAALFSSEREPVHFQLEKKKNDTCIVSLPNAVSTELL